MHRILRFTESCDVARFSGVSRPKNLDTPPETRNPQKRRGAGDGDSKAEEQLERGLGARELERLEAGEGRLQRQGSLVHAGCEGAGWPTMLTPPWLEKMDPFSDTNAGVPSQKVASPRVSQKVALKSCFPQPMVAPEQTPTKSDHSWLSGEERASCLSGEMGPPKK